MTVQTTPSDLSASITPTPSLESDKLDYITMKVEEVAEGIRTRRFSAVSVMEYFLAKAKAANSEYNCVTQFLTETALESARNIDDQLSQGKEFVKSEYPLLGVPISIKDTIDIAGVATVCGYKSQLNQICSEDSHVVSIIRKCGGIPFCKTNVPQFCITSESSNPVYGTTLNPNNKLYTPGGSSSGEASLVKAGGSLLGIGSDISGSLRIPAHFSGIYSFKPTSTRFPIKGHFTLCEGQDNLKLCMGPLATRVEDLNYLVMSVLSKQPWLDFTSEIAPLPFNKVNLEKKKLKVGYLLSDEMFPPAPACKRALLETVEKLKLQGHEVIPITYDRIEESTYNFTSMIMQDGFSGVFTHLTDEGLDPTVKATVQLVKMPYLVRYTLGKLAKYVFQQEFVHDLLVNAGKLDINGILQLHHVRDTLKQNFLSVWDKNQLDCLILPTVAFPAFKIGDFKKCSLGYTYCSTFTAFDMPAGVIPATTVNKDTDAMGDVNTWLKDNLKPEIYRKGVWFQQDAYSCYNAEEMHGLPVGIQVACKRYEDEKLLEVMQLIDNCIKGKAN